MQTKTLATIALRLRGRPDLARYLAQHLHTTPQQRAEFLRACGIN